MDVCTTNRRMASEISRAVVNALGNSGFTYSENRLVVLFSGGGDSVALLAALVEIRGAEGIFALHVNYALRGDESDGDEQFCREFCERLGVDLEVVRAPIEIANEGNLQARAREFRYRLAAERAAALGDAMVVTAHTADDQAETILYRLFASPGRDALQGMKSSPEGVIRPFLKLRRNDLREWCRERGFEWREDSSNQDDRFARVRARKLLADAESLHPSAVENLLATIETLGDETAALDAVVEQLLEDALTETGTLSAASIEQLAPSLAARVLRRFVERTGTRTVHLGRTTLDDVLRLAREGGSSEVQFEGGAVLVEYGEIRPVDGEDAATVPPATTLAVPGEARFGEWLFGASETAGTMAETRAGSGFKADLELSAGAAGLTVRGRAPGDRIKPRGLGGSKSLQDLFVDAKVPRRMRDLHPVVCEGDRIVWVPGLAVAETDDGDSAATVTVTATRIH